ncbi:MAG: hypothetical protein JJT96_11295 [Opitutales bacterium]|nr:hypothetical protein [Opitutales bacterium]
MTLEKLFQTIDNLPGINGSFCLDADGRLLCQTLQAPFHESLFADLIPRVQTLYEAVKESYAPIEEFIIEFDGFFLFLRRGLRDRTVGVVSTERPNLVALRVSCNLILKQLPDSPESASKDRGNAPAGESAKAEEAPTRKSIFGVFKRSDAPEKPKGNGIWG